MTKVYWRLPAVAALITIAAFLILDPERSVVMALSAGTVVATFLILILWCFRNGLLLSPVGDVVIGPLMIAYYTWGNLGARVTGENRLVSNPGSLAYYPLAELLAAVGVMTFAVIVMKLSPRSWWRRRVRFEDLVWEPWQAVACASIGVVTLGYLSWKYPFVGGYFRGVESHFDRWVSAAQYWFIILGTYAGVSVIVRAKEWLAFAMGVVSIGVPLIVAMGMRSRTSMVMVILTACLAWLTLRPKKPLKPIAVAGALAVGVFAIGSLGKVINISSQSIVESLSAVGASSRRDVTENNRIVLEQDSQYRLGGLEMPATILMCQDRGAVPMYGGGLLGGSAAALPAFVRSTDNVTERTEIFRNYARWGMAYGDSVGIPLSSGLADWGIVGSVIIYVIISLFCAGMWRVAQMSPRLYVAYLMAGITVGDLFWDNALFSFRAIVFAWIILFALGGLLMPKWIPGFAGEENREATKWGVRVPAPALARERVV